MAIREIMTSEGKYFKLIPKGTPVTAHNKSIIYSLELNELGSSDFETVKNRNFLALTYYKGETYALLENDARNILYNDGYSYEPFGDDSNQAAQFYIKFKDLIF